MTAIDCSLDGGIDVGAALNVQHDTQVVGNAWAEANFADQVDTVQRWGAKHRKKQRNVAVGGLVFRVGDGQVHVELSEARRDCGVDGPAGAVAVEEAAVSKAFAGNAEVGLLGGLVTAALVAEAACADVAAGAAVAGVVGQVEARVPALLVVADAAARRTMRLVAAFPVTSAAVVVVVALDHAAFDPIVGDQAHLLVRGVGAGTYAALLVGRVEGVNAQRRRDDDPVEVGRGDACRVHLGHRRG